MESEIFGHVKGAFTGAVRDRDGAASSADGGVLFLDEICEMDMQLQSKLLRFIQTGKFQKVGGTKLEAVDIRFICATNREPMKEVEEGRFREDLFYRLHVIPISLPPLRERDDDVLLIANKFLKDFALEEGKDFKKFSPECELIMQQYSWPGNVREVQNVIRNLVVLNNEQEVTSGMLPFNIDSPINKASIKSGGQIFVAQEPIESTEIQPLWQIEKNAIEQAIELCHGNIPKAAAMLDVSPSTIYRKRQSWND
jgi:two-component system repressor protein LuxO